MAQRAKWLKIACKKWSLPDQLGINYKDVFLEPLASNIKSWIVSKKFSLQEFTDLLGTDSIAHYVQPAYCNSTTAEMADILSLVDKMRFFDDGTPDTDSDVKLYHALNDSIVAPENSRMMYEWLVSKGLQNVVIDTTSLTHGHMGSGSYFILNVMTSDLNDWEWPWPTRASIRSERLVMALANESQ